MRRFIAGAVCPECGKQDKIFLDKQGEDTVRACVSCDFSESLAEQSSNEPNGSTQTVRLVDDVKGTPKKGASDADKGNSEKGVSKDVFKKGTSK